MYALFNRSELNASGGVKFFQMLRLRQQLQRSLDKVTNYYRSYPHAVDGRHFLIRLLYSLHVPTSLDIEVYSDKVGDIALEAAMAVKMTSPYSRGVVYQPGVFYGKNVSEILIATIDDYDTSLLETSWRELQSIRVLSHPKSDLWMHLPNGRYNTDEGGFAVITVNIPMLASQYLQWRREQQALNLESPRSIAQFLLEIPIPNMLPTHLDNAIVNRLINRYFDLPNANIRNPHSFQIPDFSQEIDGVLDRYLERLHGRQWRFDTIVDTLPLAVAESYHDVIALPEMAYTKQVEWAVTIARLPLVAWLVQMNAAGKNNSNSQNLRYLKQYLRSIRLDNSMREALRPARYQEVMTLIERGITPYL